MTGGSSAARRETGRLDWVVTEHRITSRHLCACGWEGVSATVHIIDVLGIEQVGWLQDADTLDPAPVKMSQGSEFYAGDVGVCVPVYRLRAARHIGKHSQGEATS